MANEMLNRNEIVLRKIGEIRHSLCATTSFCDHLGERVGIKDTSRRSKIGRVATRLRASAVAHEAGFNIESAACFNQARIGFEHLADELAFGVAARDDHGAQQRAVAAGPVEEGAGGQPLGDHEDQDERGGDEQPLTTDGDLEKDAQSAGEQHADGDAA